MSTDTDLPAAEVLSPQEYGFPKAPTPRQITTWTLQEQFLSEYSTCGAVYLAAHAAGHSPEAYFKWVNTDKYMFQKRFEIAQSRFLEKMEREADRRGMEGVDHPVVYKGEITATYKDYSDNLLMFRMKKLDPSYRENYTVTVEGSQELINLLQKRQAEDAKALPAPDESKVIEHRPSDEKPPWEQG